MEFCSNLIIVDYHTLPSPECKDAVVKGGTFVGADIELVAMPFYGFHGTNVMIQLQDKRKRVLTTPLIGKDLNNGL